MDSQIGMYHNTLEMEETQIVRNDSLDNLYFSINSSIMPGVKKMGWMVLLGANTHIDRAPMKGCNSRSSVPCRGSCCICGVMANRMAITTKHKLMNTPYSP